MTKEKNARTISTIKQFNTDYLVGNVVVAKSTKIKYQINGDTYWYPLSIEEDLHRINTIDSLDYYPTGIKTPEGQAMYDEWKAKQDEEDDD
jgi:hypothetical protein